MTYGAGRGGQWGQEPGARQQPHGRGTLVPAGLADKGGFMTETPPHRMPDAFPTARYGDHGDGDPTTAPVPPQTRC